MAWKHGKQNMKRMIDTLNKRERLLAENLSATSDKYSIVHTPFSNNNSQLLTINYKLLIINYKLFTPPPPKSLCIKHLRNRLTLYSLLCGLYSEGKSVKIAGYLDRYTHAQYSYFCQSLLLILIMLKTKKQNTQYDIPCVLQFVEYLQPKGGLLLAHIINSSDYCFTLMSRVGYDIIYHDERSLKLSNIYNISDIY
jgi:hypothetical protein